MNRQSWWEDAIIYQIYPMSFNDSTGNGIGDINGIKEKLDYIKSLGVNTLWVNPVVLSNHVDNGYDVIDYTKVDPLFGSEEDSRSFIEEAKKREFRLIFDFPLNHTSDQHPWFKSALKGKDDPYRDYYIWADSEGDPYPNNWTAGFGGPAWTKEMNGDQYYLHLFMEQMPDLNWDHEPLRKEMAEVINYWSDQGVDGVRMDAFIYIDIDKEFPEHPEDFGSAQEVSSNGKLIKEYLTEMNERINKEEKEIFMIGEATSADAERIHWYTNDNMVDKIISLQHFTDKEEDKIEDLPKEKQHVPLDMTKFKDMQKAFQENLFDKGGPILFWNNHDRPRAPQKYGDMEEYRDETAKTMATLLYLQRGIPIIYYGEEIGMNNAWFDDPGNVTDSGVREFYNSAREYGWSHEEAMKNINLTARDGSRGIMQWTDDKYAGFTDDADPWIKYNRERKYNVRDQEKDENSILHYYRKLLDLKKTNLFKNGDWSLDDETKENLYVYKRTYQGQKGLVCCNFSSETETYQIKSSDFPGEMVLSVGEVDVTDTEITLGPYSSCVLVN